PQRRVERHAPSVAIDRHGQGARGSFYAHRGGTHAGEQESVGPHHVVVLSIYPTLARYTRRCEQTPEDAAMRRWWSERADVELLRGQEILGLGHRGGIQGGRICRGG